MIDDVKRFMRVSGQLTTDCDQFDAKLTSLYVGLCCEELSELLVSINGRFFNHDLAKVSEMFKNDEFKASFARLSDTQKAEMLDAFIDLAWVAIGGAYAMGVNVPEAVKCVTDANLSKFEVCSECEGNGQYYDRWFKEVHCLKCDGYGLIAVKDANGKVKKPQGWQPPDMLKFIV